jgi:hypothetical protein
MERKGLFLCSQELDTGLILSCFISLNIHFNIIVPPTPRCPELSVPFFFYRPYLLPLTTYNILFILPNIISWRVQFMRFPNIQLSSPSCYNIFHSPEVILSTLFSNIFNQFRSLGRESKLWKKQNQSYVYLQFYVSEQEKIRYIIRMSNTTYHSYYSFIHIFVCIYANFNDL